MSANRIAMASEVLLDLARKLDLTASDLRSGTHLRALDFEGFDKTRAAFSELNGKWDQRREDLANALTEGAVNVRTVVRTFTAVDEKLAAELRKGES